MVESFLLNTLIIPDIYGPEPIEKKITLLDIN
jgi:hypothetical protein